ncbi:hypothetical protein ARMGADRAFT_1035322 [Armillaria gallica]|uniref:Uncharacterized protein n=1 Tax=Armillaria gallica TaxID=47427 RepID=A0A2H3DCF5_ARMGA|nr:hypothetical protein ARMGADRAFT_1035322 [Armillaria gallica]
MPRVQPTILDTSNIILTTLGMSDICLKLQLHVESTPGIDLKVGRIYSAMAWNPAYVLVPSYRPKMRRQSIRNYDTDSYVCDLYQSLYTSSTMGYGTVVLNEQPGMELHFFFCPLQVVAGVEKNENTKNPTLSAHFPPKTSWYGNFLIMVTVDKKPVNFEQMPTFSDLVDDTVKKFVIDYVGEFLALKQGANYQLVRNEAIPTFLNRFTVNETGTMIL